MKRLTKDDRKAFRELTDRRWVQSPQEASPRIVEPTPEAREQYRLWATEAARFFKGRKPVRFGGAHWKL